MDNFPVTDPPPNTPVSDSVPTLLECVVCTDECQWPPALEIFGHCMCKECFDIGMKPQFENHLKNEFAAPKWEGDVIEIDSVKANFTPEFVREYKLKMDEYAVFPKSRIYCAGRNGEPCGSFIGSKDEMPATAACLKCGTLTCAVCSSRLNPRALYKHDCQEQKEDTSAMDGLQRGKDFQFCPECATPCQLMDGCNHITCEFTACGCEFCFICGEQATEVQGHWDVGKPCPKYNHPDDGNAVFEPPLLTPGLPLADPLLDWPELPPDLMQADRDVDTLFVEINHDLADRRMLNEPGQPEAILRRVDRQKLDEIQYAVLDFFDSAEHQGQVQPWILMLIDFITVLPSSLQIYTLQSSPEEVRQAWTRHRWATAGHLDHSVTITDFPEVRRHFPDLLPIINRWQLADANVEGWQEQFRLQLEAMRVDSVERQRIQAIQQEVNRLLFGMQHR